MRSGFFNSDLTGYASDGTPIFDRAEDAEFFAKYFSRFIGNGVYPAPSDGFQVVENENMNVKVMPGFAFINGYFGWEDTERVMTVQASDTTYDRIDLCVLRLNYLTRVIDLYIVAGAASANPVAPTLNRPVGGSGGDIYELGIAEIFVSKNSTAIPQYKITDTRHNANVCGIASGVIDQVDTTTLFVQYQNALNQFLGIVNDAIDDTLAGDIILKLTQDKGVLTVPGTATWRQLTTNTATIEEKANDPTLANSWYTDVLLDCTENDFVELQPNVPTSELGIAFYNRSLNNAIRIYASSTLAGNELKFMVVSKRKRNGG